MHWTNKYPDRPGWYWFRYRMHDNWYETMLEVTTILPTKEMFKDGDSLLSIEGGQWSNDPIPLPDDIYASEIKG